MEKTFSSNNPKSLARLSAVQSYYSMLVDKNQNKANALNSAFEVHAKEKLSVKRKFAEELLDFCLAEKESIEFIIKKYMNREHSFETINPLLLSITSVALAELLKDTTTDRPIIISEYLRITSEFFDTSETGFVNAVMDKFVKENNTSTNTQH